MRRKWIGLLLVLLLLGAWALPVAAQTGIRVVENQAALAFPNSVTFSALAQSGVPITQVALEYGVDQLTCGEVIARTFPEFTSAPSVEASWTWDMRQSGSLPPGARIWWRWQITDASGETYQTPTQSVIWLDDIHDWQTISGGNVNLHYYHGGEAFGNDLHTAAVEALTRLAREVGLQPEAPIDLYIYADTQDLRDAILYEPSWAGGLAFPEHSIVIIGIAPADLEWGKRTEAHEITHVLVGNLTFSCLGFIPTWLNEGLAMVGEGGLEDYQVALFERALAEDSFPSLRSLSGGFSEESDRANLSYAMSYSVVNFLAEEYGRQRLNNLLDLLTHGATLDVALETVYGFDVDGLENAWRESIGAPPRAGGAAPTLAATPTIVPTIVPVSGLPGAVTNPTPRPTSTSSGAVPATQVVEQAPTAAAPGVSGPPFGLSSETMTIIQIGIICMVMATIVVAVPIVATYSRRNRRKHSRKEKVQE
ncbi:MAG: hypothetical protein JXB85_07545 [Anaerolineales bacterium]|nr:hypothetical protein [Anaerolineales bacterium]